MDRQAFAFWKYGNPAQHELNLVGGLNCAGGVRVGPCLERLVGDKLVPVTSRGAPVLTRHGSGDADHPCSEPVRLSQSSEVSVGPQETLPAPGR